ncbi:MAG: ribosome small subunit-dependent GTPase A [Planctomycetes bacterium]|nr:ribosome small subunit-dependent GTPase A [Planctomycetota bacterium]
MRDRYAKMSERRALREENERAFADERKERKARKQKQRYRPRVKPGGDPTDTDAGPDGPVQARPPSGPPPARAGRELRVATVLGVDRTHVEVLTDGVVVHARRHPRLTSVVAGDEVQVSTDQHGALRAESLVARRTLLVREDPARPGRPKPIAANLDLGIVTIPADRPRFGLVARIRTALHNGGIGALLVLTKADLIGAAEHADVLATFESTGLSTLRVSIHTGEGLAALAETVRGRTCAFLGHSGAGKSSLCNALDPGGLRRVGAVRDRDARGRHTTSRATLSLLPDGTRILDTPGIRAFGVVDDGTPP